MQGLYKHIDRTACILLVLALAGCNSANNNEDKAAPAPAVVTTTPPPVSGEYHLKANYSAFNTTVEVLFTDTRDSISETQKKNYEGFLQKQDQLQPQIMKSIFVFYKKAYPAYKEGWETGEKLSDEEIEKNLPKPTTAEKLKSFITPSAIYIQSKNDCAEGTLIIEFNCPWDMENGLSVRIKNWEVAEVNTADSIDF